MHPAIVYAPLRQGIPGIKTVLGLHVHDQADRLPRAGGDGAKTNVNRASALSGTAPAQGPDSRRRRQSRTWRCARRRTGKEPRHRYGPAAAAVSGVVVYQDTPAAVREDKRLLPRTVGTEEMAVGLRQFLRKIRKSTGAVKRWIAHRMYLHNINLPAAGGNGLLYEDNIQIKALTFLKKI